VFFGLAATPEGCIDKATASAQHDEMIDVLVGFKKSIKVNIGAGSFGNWRYGEEQIVGPNFEVRGVVRLHGGLLNNFEGQ